MKHPYVFPQDSPPGRDGHVYREGGITTRLLVAALIYAGPVWRSWRESLSEADELIALVEKGETEKEEEAPF